MATEDPRNPRGGQSNQGQRGQSRDTYQPNVAIPGPFPTQQKDQYLAQAAARAASRHSTPPTQSKPTGGFGSPSAPPAGLSSPFPPSTPPRPQQGFGAGAQQGEDESQFCY